MRLPIVYEIATLGRKPVDGDEFRHGQWSPTIIKDKALEEEEEMG